MSKLHLDIGLGVRPDRRREVPGINPGALISSRKGRHWVEWHEDKASLGGLLFDCPGGAEEFSPGFQPWETSNKAVRPERSRDGVGERPFDLSQRIRAVQACLAAIAGFFLFCEGRILTIWPDARLSEGLTISRSSGDNP
jgi:hypothetical protein